ncbi:MAG: hypothetical protein KDC76_07435, partial [Bacteroidetes bacterium]|nr:hypothetical protein [Bacteroidota bacterium]
MRTKKLKLRWFLVLTFLIGSQTVFGQADRILQAIEDGNYKRALSLAEESEEDPEYKKDPEVYFLKAEA